MSQNFPILKLPYLAIETVLLRMEHLVLIEFSLCSTKCKKLAKSLPKFIDSIAIDVFQSQLTINLSTYGGWAFKKHSGGRARRKEVRNFGGSLKSLKIQKCGDRGVNVFCPNKPEKTMKLVLDYLFDLYKIENCEVDFSTHGMSAEVSRSFFENLIFNENVVKTCKSLSIKAPPPLPHYYYDFIFSNFSKDLNNLEIWHESYSGIDHNYRTDSNFEFATEKLSLTNAAWMTKHTFLSLLNCRHVELLVSNITVEVCMDFIGNWLKGGSRLEYLKIEVAPLKQGPFGNAFWQTFGGVPWDPEVRKRDFDSPNLIAPIDCSQGWDILRDDGVMATALDPRWSFTFVVWNRRF